MITQIYETQSAEEARNLVALGIDHIGVLVGDGAFPREKSIAEALDIFSAVILPAKRSALSLSPNIEEIAKIAEAIKPEIMHIGTTPESISAKDLKQLKLQFPQIKWMRSIPVVDEASIQLAREYENIADFLLLDTHKSGDEQIGATGEIHDWAISKKIVEAIKTPVILAGGLGPENVAEAIRAIQPAGVDSKTRTDIDGAHYKDLDKVKRFVENTEP